MDIEIWKNVPGYEGLYQVSSHGNVKSLANNKNRKEKILKQYPNKSGYLRLILWNNKVIKCYRVHQLVAIAFMKHVPDGLTNVVDHIDGNVSNNRLDNLQVVPTRINTLRGIKTNKHGYTGVSYRYRDKCYYSRINVNGKEIHLGSYMTAKEAGIAYENALKRRTNQYELFLKHVKNNKK